MSLISQKDRELAIAAFENYAEHLECELSFLETKDPQYKEYSSELYELNTLLNWVRLEYFKHEN